MIDNIFILYFQPSLIQMRQELDQITSNISENPFMKNDMKRKDNYVAETREENELIPEKPAEEQEQGGQKDDLKKELTQVLKELRKSEEDCEEGRLSKVRYELNSDIVDYNKIF